MTTNPIIEFTQDPDRRARLSAVLVDPVFAEAIDIVLETMKPKVGGPGDANTIIAASHFHQTAGANHLLDKLRSMTRPITPATPLKVKSLAASPDDLPKT